MAYKAYVTPKYYLETYRGTSIPKSELDLRLRDASRHINSLTYSRIVGRGFSALTEFQQDVIREVVCRQADFEAENREALDCALSSYSINGVSMTLAAGLNCVQYKNGARHTLADYADMAIRTACKRAKLQGEGQMRQEWGVSTVIMNKRGKPCPKCLPWVGKVLIDDVWSGESHKDGPYPLMSTAIAAGLYHPRCKDGHTTYFEGISTPPDSKFTRKELKQIEKDNRKEAQKQYAERQKDKFGRLADYSLNPENKRRYTARKNAWGQEKAVEKSSHPAIMKLPRAEQCVIPRAKLTEYALNPEKDPNKAEAFRRALGYTKENADELIEQIQNKISLYEATERGDKGYGMTYQVVMDIEGPNGKSAKVLTAWIDDREKLETRLTTIHVD